MHRRHRIEVVVVCGLLLLLSACFEVDEWVRVAPSGETRLQATVRIGADPKTTGQLPKMDVSSQMGNAAAQIPGLRVTQSKAEQRDGQMIATTEVATERFGNLERFYQTLPTPPTDKSATDNPAADLGNVLSKGTFYRASLRGHRIHIERRLVPVKTAKPKVKKKKSGEGLAGLGDMSDFLFSGIFLRFALSLPAPIVGSNAETVDGQTAHWVYPLQYLTKHKTTLWVDIEATPEARRALLR